jgi:multicomponent Na+:H+ antiporter subunit D
MTAISFNPGFALLLGAALVLVTPRQWRSWIALAASLAALMLAFTPSFGEHGAFAQIGLRVAPLRLDALSQTFGMIFALVTIMLALHGGGARSREEEAALLVHAGGALGAVYAGDFVAFVALAELSTVAAVALLLSRSDKAAKEAGQRLLGWQALSSVLFLAGAAFAIAMQGAADFAQLSARTPAGLLILIALGVKAGFPIAHVWLKDAAPRGSAAGGAALLVFTTMLGVYGLARGFAGEPALVWIGVAMTLLPALHAMAEDDLRRALAYGMTVQTGFIVACIGLGSPLAIAAAAAHAVATTLAFVLLAMALGAVLERTGTTRASKLGGLARTMPVTATLACIAALSIAGAPFTAGFASLALALDSFQRGDMSLLYFALVIAAGAAVAHTAVKIPYAAFFAPQRSKPAPPTHFGEPHLAMLVAAVLIVGIGVAPGWLYAFLPPDPVTFSPYDWGRLMVHVQLATFAALAFAAARAAKLHDVDEGPSDLRDIDALIYGPLWRLVQRAGGALEAFHLFWRRREAAAAAQIGRWAETFLTLADRPARRLATDGAWLLAIPAALLVVIFVFAR